MNHRVGRIKRLVWTALVFSAAARADWLYFNSFQSGKLDVYDLASGKVIREIAVEDGNGGIGFAASRDGRTLFLVDGDRSSRLRILDAASGRTVAEHGFENRTLTHGGGPVAVLSGDGRWLFLSTYDYAAAASGVRIFDVQSRRFLPLGLRSRPCASPLLADVADGRLFAVCPGVAQELRPLPVAGEFLAGKSVPIAIQAPVDAVAARDTNELFVLEGLQAGRQWRMARWRPGQESAVEVDLLRHLDIRGRGDGRGFMDLSADGGQVAFTAGRRAWICDPSSLKVLRRIDLPSAAAGIAFRRGEPELLILIPQKETGVTLVRASTGGSRSVAVKELHVRSNATVFVVAPAPSSE